MEPPNKGHVGTRSFVLYREVSFIRRLKCTGIIGIGMSRFVLIERCSLFGVSFIRGSTVYYTLWRFDVSGAVSLQTVGLSGNPTHPETPAFTLVLKAWFGILAEFLGSFYADYVRFNLCHPYIEHLPTL